MASRNKALVPEARQALNQLKYEIAGELGSGGAPGDLSSEFAGEVGAVGAGTDWGSLTTRQAGYIGGSMTRALVQKAQQILGGASGGS
jgi:hypothetical protein